jgi:sulfur carrier protein
VANEIQIEINGERRTAQPDLTVAGLLRQLDIRPDRVAVELNLHVLERAEFEQRSLREGDRIEIISFIGGGQRSVHRRSEVMEPI